MLSYDVRLMRNELAFFLPMAIGVLGGAGYHLTQKFISPNVHPGVVILTAYVIAMLFGFSLFWLIPMNGTLASNISQLNWANFAMGVAIGAIEIGFITAYRSGWNLSLASIVSGAAINVLLVPLGLLLFREQLSLVNWVGVALSLAGLILVNVK